MLFTSLLSAQNNTVLPGADVLLSDSFNLIRGKKLGIVTNHTGLLKSGIHLVDTLFNRKEVTISALFAPEHGIRGDAPDGDTIRNYKDPKTGIQVYSLYIGESNNKPTKEMLKNIDVLVFDIQDAGVRFYTFISTLYYLLQAAAENNIPVLVLDRPDPVSGINVDGPIRKDSLASFVGIAPIPILPGLTIGELATLFNETGMIGKNIKADLTVVKMKNWRRDMFFDETGLKWVNPSPNIPSSECAVVYPGTCLIEGLNVSEGRGTLEPFLTIGAPFINADELVAELNKQEIKGIRYEPLKSYTPVEIKNMARAPKYENQKISGIKIKVTDEKIFQPVAFGIKLICTLYKLYPNKLEIVRGRFNRLSGDAGVREQILKGATAQQIIDSWQNELTEFKKLRSKCLLY